MTDLVAGAAAQRHIFSLRRSRVDQLARADNIEELWFDKKAELVGRLTAYHLEQHLDRPQLVRARALAQRTLGKIVDKHGLTALEVELETALLQAVDQYFRYWLHNAQIVRHGFGSTRDAKRLAKTSQTLRELISAPRLLNRLQASACDSEENYLVFVGRFDSMLKDVMERADRAAFRADKIKVTGSRDILMPAQILYQFYLEHVDHNAKFWTYGSSDGSASEDSTLRASPAFDFVLAALHLIDDSIERNALKELAKQLYDECAPPPEHAFSREGCPPAP